MEKSKEYKRLYNEFRSKGHSDAVARIKARTAYNNLPKKEHYAKTRTKSARESLNWYKVRNQSLNTSSFIENTHMRTLKKMIKNNLKEVSAVKGKQNSRKVNNAIKKVDNWSGSKIDLLKAIDKQYGDLIYNVSGNYNPRKDAKKSIVRESRILTKAGKKRVRFVNPDKWDKQMIKKVDLETRNNLNKAMWRILKSQNTADLFDSQGWGEVSGYFFDNIQHFSSLNGANLGDLYSQMVKTKKQIGRDRYLVKLNKPAMRLLEEWNSHNKQVVDFNLTKPIIDLTSPSIFKRDKSD